jgi:hypothetical protein
LPHFKALRFRVQRAKYVIPVGVVATCVAVWIAVFCVPNPEETAFFGLARSMVHNATTLGQQLFP